MGLISKGDLNTKKDKQKTWGEALESLPHNPVVLTVQDINWILSMLMNSKCEMRELESAVDVINKLTAMQKNLIASNG